MLARVVNWITDSLDRGLDVGFRVMLADRAAGGGGDAARDVGRKAPMARGAGVFIWDGDLTGEPLREWRWPKANRALGDTLTGAKGS